MSERERERHCVCVCVCVCVWNYVIYMYFCVFERACIHMDVYKTHYEC